MSKELQGFLGAQEQKSLKIILGNVHIPWFMNLRNKFIDSKDFNLYVQSFYLFS